VIVSAAIKRTNESDVPTGIEVRERIMI